MIFLVDVRLFADSINMQPSTKVIYFLYQNVCAIPSDISHRRILVNVTRAVCRKACSDVYSDYCSGFLYNPNDRSCTVSPYTGETLRGTHCDQAVITSGKPEFYRRRRQLGINILL